MNSLMTIGKYDQEFLERVQDLAISQMTPSQIAERLDLQGAYRKKFLQDINNPVHKLAETYRLARSSGYQDVMDSLHTGAVAGDPDCIELLVKVNHKQEVDNLKKEFFGV